MSERKETEFRVKGTAIFVWIMILILLFTVVGCSQSKEQREPVSPETSQRKKDDIKATLNVLNWGNLQEVDVYNQAIK